jgi:putative transposase
MDGLTYPERGHAQLRRGRLSEAGRVYLITFVTADRQPMFVDWSAALAVVRASRSTRIWHRSNLLCWVLMPDHWHGLVELGDRDSVASVVNRLKCNTARAVNALRDRRGHVWAKGFHDHALRADEAVREASRYLIRNPVRAGLVERVGHYPFWDAIWLDRVRGSNACL